MKRAVRRNAAAVITLPFPGQIQPMMRSHRPDLDFAALWF